MRTTWGTQGLALGVVLVACNSGSKPSADAPPIDVTVSSDAPSEPAPEASGTPLTGRHGELAVTARHFVDEILELETNKDVTCWVSFRQLDTFISAKSYSDFAILTKTMAVKALAQAVWAAASEKAAGSQVQPEDLEAVFSIEAELPAAKKAELEKFAEDLGWQQFRDYRTTGEHWRILLSIAQDELARPKPSVKPLTVEGEQRLALMTTRLALSLLTESGQIATQARTPLIEAEHVQRAYQNLLQRHAIPEAPAPGESLDHARANQARVPLTGALIDAKIKALHRYNAGSDDLAQEIAKISRVPLEPEAVDRLVAQLEDFTRFVSLGAEPMRSDNHLAPSNWAPKDIEPKPYVDPAHVENVTQQLFPYVVMPNGDVKLRFEPRPGHISPRDLFGQDVTLLDHQMNAVRDTAIHWVILQRVFKERPFAMDPFAAEYLSELVSIMATLYLRRAQTMARQEDRTTIGADLMLGVQDLGYVQVMPASEGAIAWGPKQQAAKAKALASYRGPLFADVTSAWGLPRELPPARTDAHPGSDTFDIQAVMGAGIAVGDVDGDGTPDLFLSGEGLGRLLLNRPPSGEGGGRSFEDATNAWKVPGELTDSRGALLWDYDGDDDLDLLVLRSRSASLLLQNDGEQFTDVALSKGLKTRNGAHVATAFDYDTDGDLDLYVGYYGSADCNTGNCPGRNLPALDGRNGSANQLFRYDSGAGTFVEVGAAAGVADEGWTLAASSFDYDDDGDFDLYLANDFGANPLFRNEGDGTFTDVAAQVGAADRGSGMNVSFADLDDNGAFDVFVSNIDMYSKNIKIVFPSDDSVVQLSDQILESFQYLSGNKLYLNLPAEPGGRRFEPRESTWFEPGDRGWGWAGVFFDYELDGDEDVYLANGWIPGSPAADQRNQMFIRAGDVFYQSPEGDAAPETFAGNSRSVVAFDMDGDGDLDLAVNNFAGPPVLLENLQKARGNHWLEVRLRGKSPNTRAVGAVIEAKVGKKTMRRLVTLGNGYLGQDGPLVHFGLGRARKTDLHISWPDGTEQWIRGVKADAVVEVTQAAGGGPG